MSAGMGGEGIDGTTVIGRGSYEVALLAAGGVIAAVDAVLDGVVDNAYALVRPPGHHALPDAAMGFCLFGNVAIAAHHARQARGLARVAIVDWDVHHGNGTQAAFYDDPTRADDLAAPGQLLPARTRASIEENGDGPRRGLQRQRPAPARLGRRRLRRRVRAGRRPRAGAVPARADRRRLRASTPARWTRSAG